MCISYSLSKWRILSSLNGSPPIILTIEPRMVIIFWAYNPVSFKHISFWYKHISWSHTWQHIKYRRLIKINNQIKHVYLTMTLNLKVTDTHTTHTGGLPPPNGNQHVINALCRLALGRVNEWNCGWPTWDGLHLPKTRGDKHSLRVVRYFE